VPSRFSPLTQSAVKNAPDNKQKPMASNVTVQNRITDLTLMGVVLLLRESTKNQMRHTPAPSTVRVQYVLGLRAPMRSSRSTTGRKFIGIVVENIEHPTSNIQHPVTAQCERHWVFDVGCWLLDVEFPVSFGNQFWPWSGYPDCTAMFISSDERSTNSNHDSFE
jgi:hypothetical protein